MDSFAWTRLTLATSVAIVLLAAGPVGGADRAPFGIRVVDDATGRGVPLVELSTVHDLRFVTDSAGLAAIREPELLGQSVFVSVRSHGYEFPRDGFGFRGRAVTMTPGMIETFKIHRINLAERLYRVTGAGLYADSVELGQPVPIRQPLLNAQVTGSDSVVMGYYHGKLHWFWGDTNRLRYPLGNFNVTGATSRLPADGGLDPDVGIDLDYFAGKEGFARPMAPVPGEGPTWIWGVVVLRGVDGRERMFAGYEKVRGQLDVYERGICEFDDERQEFVKVRSYGPRVPLHLQGHPLQHRDGDTEFVYFGDPYPFVRVRADADALLDLDQYEGFTCLERGAESTDPRVERDASGKLVWGWKRGTAAITIELQKSLVNRSLISPDEAWIQLRDVQTNRPVIAHRGSVTWNAFRKRWILITTEIGGRSQLGEVWYAEAESLQGPWQRARRIVTHDRYSFYNPKQHPMFQSADGRQIYFEGTYTRSFSGNPDATPRYDYNQILYRLDLAHPDLAAAQAR